MDIIASNRIQQLSTGIFTELANRKRRAVENGISVIDLSVGSPDLPPPSIVIHTLKEYVQDTSKYGYTLTGTPDFLRAVAYFYKERYGVGLNPDEEILQLMGSQDGLAHLAMAIVNPGEYVLVPDPGYPIYEASVTIAGGHIYPMPLLKENNFLPKFEDIPIDILRKTKMMIISYPGNPVTALADRSFFQQVIDFAKTNNILVVHDFAYSELIFDGRQPVSFLSVPGAKEVGIEFNSLSKTFNMAGCRIGYAAGNSKILRILADLKSNIDYGIFYPIQKAAEAALTSDFSTLRSQVLEYESRREVLINGLANAGWKIDPPPATMFVWAAIPKGWTSKEFVYDLIEEAGVAVVPGDAFGGQGEGYVRIALVQPAERLAEAADRIGEFLKKAKQ
ncbi:LL-diaminopimelate aminotransferase [Fodinisporobacter ferrooxydans]|uniref:Aminotransferase n=1 Tax=Fodinisporobacter ferrooxydans TaxID=2901836 RepID=A0ABY4CR65_9BACL|nr:LL-diaminopimelate aminotransferase [Alicyclobacillaceae bacterium MYW30-H2]